MWALRSGAESGKRVSREMMRLGALSSSRYRNHGCGVGVQRFWLLWQTSPGRGWRAVLQKHGAIRCSGAGLIWLALFSTRSLGLLSASIVCKSRLNSVFLFHDHMRLVHMDLAKPRGVYTPHIPRHSSESSTPISQQLTMTSSILLQGASPALVAACVHSAELSRRDELYAHISSSTGSRRPLVQCFFLGPRPCESTLLDLLALTIVILQLL